MADSVKDEIEAACHSLGIAASDFRILPDEEAVPLLRRIEKQFVTRSGLRWWWEAFCDTLPVTRHHVSNGEGWRYLARIVPTGIGQVYFVAEEDEMDTFIVCAGMVEAIQSVIGECYGFEYYVVSHELDWLICENHHDMLIAVGQPVADRLLRLNALPCGE